MKSYKEFINESNEMDRDELDNLINPIRDDISDMLVDFVGYDIKFIPVNMLDSSVVFQLHIFRKGWPLPGYESIDPVLVDRDILDDLVRVCDFIKSEIGFSYTHSYYYYNHFREEDIFKSGGKKVVTSISMFFTFN
jgi:hypothetical protein